MEKIKRYDDWMSTKPDFKNDPSLKDLHSAISGLKKESDPDLEMMEMLCTRACVQYLKPKAVALKAKLKALDPSKPTIPNIL